MGRMGKIGVMGWMGKMGRMNWRSVISRMGDMKKIITIGILIINNNA